MNTSHSQQARSLVLAALHSWKSWASTTTEKEGVVEALSAVRSTPSTLSKGELRALCERKASYLQSCYNLHSQGKPENSGDSEVMEAYYAYVTYLRVVDQFC